MDINDLFDGIMKSTNQFAEGRSRTSCASRHSNVPVHQIAEQRLQEKMQGTGRSPENEGKNTKNVQAKETSMPGRKDWDSQRPVAKRQASGKWSAIGV